MPSYVNCLPGDPFALKPLAGLSGERLNLDLAAGRWQLIAFLGDPDQHPASLAALTALRGRLGMIHQREMVMTLVLAGPPSAPDARLAGFRVALDPERELARRAGVAPVEAARSEWRPLWLLLDPGLRVHKIAPIVGPDGGAAQILAELAALPPVESYLGFAVAPPVLVIPGVFEAGLCTDLIAAYEAAGGELSGFMIEQDGRTIGKHDARTKVRRDHLLADPDLIARARERIVRRVLPEIARVHCFAATRMERYLVAAYDAEEGGHFTAHRDNTTSGTAHRRFAVSINLNGDFDGGQVRFPEYGPGGYRAPPGGAVVFSCSLLHAVAPVTSGRRYAFLPFLYDEAAAALRGQMQARLLPTAGEEAALGRDRPGA